MILFEATAGLLCTATGFVLAVIGLAKVDLRWTAWGMGCALIGVTFAISSHERRKHASKGAPKP